MSDMPPPREQAAQLRAEGLTFRAIAATLAVSPSTVRHWFADDAAGTALADAPAADGLCAREASGEAAPRAQEADAAAGTPGTGPRGTGGSFLASAAIVAVLLAAPFVAVFVFLAALFGRLRLAFASRRPDPLGWSA